MSTLAKDTHHDHDHKPTGLKRWFFSTNHKDIGTLYLIFALTMFFVGGAMAMIIRAELFQPGLQFVDPQFYNSMVTIHALVMIFGAVMPAGVGLANWMIIDDICGALSHTVCQFLNRNHIWNNDIANLFYLRLAFPHTRFFPLTSDRC